MLLLLYLIVLAFVRATTPCMYYCRSGDTLQGTTCTDTYTPTLECQSGFSIRGGYCYRDACIGENAVIGSKYMESCTTSSSGRTDTNENTGCTNDMVTCQQCKCCYCYTGSRRIAKSSGNYLWNCYTVGGFFTITPKPDAEHWCYTSPSSPITCPSGSQYVGGNQCRDDDVVRTCLAGGSLNANNMCVRTYAASVVTTSAQCSVSPSTATLCDWCTGIKICMPNNNCVQTCYDVRDQATCNRQGSACHWCAEIGVCLPDTIDDCPYRDCFGATRNPTACSKSTACLWCDELRSIGVCQQQSVACFNSCLAATANLSACAASIECKWCDTGSSIGVCQPNAEKCYSTCPQATAEQPVCSSSVECYWCGSIDVCQTKWQQCYGTCLQSTADSVVCDASLQCKWCDITSSIGVCQPNAGTCYTTCLQSTADSAVCDVSKACKWCDTGTSIGVCQPESGMCYASCLDASITAEAAVCSGSLLCEWCSGPAHLPYCRRNDEACLSRCVYVAPYNPGICQVPSVGGTCQWCGALEYCVDADDVAILRCASRCETMIWRRDVCDGALACHWCPQHGGRCKPVKGRTQGYVGWRGESECDTGSGTASVTDVVSATATSSLQVSRSLSVTCGPRSMSDTVSSTRSDESTPTESQTISMSASASVTLSFSLSQSHSLSHSQSYSKRSLTSTPSISTTASRTSSSSQSSSVTKSTPMSATATTSASRTATVTESRSLSCSTSTSVSVSGTTSHSLTRRSESATSVTVSETFHLPPCNATHAAVVSFLWPTYFAFDATYTTVKSAGFASVDVIAGRKRADDGSRSPLVELDPELIYWIPLLLRNPAIPSARPQLVTPVPFEPPNALGFLHRSDTPVRLTWVNRSAIRVEMSAIPDYWIDTSEEITIDVPFEEIVYCNRTDPVSVWVNPTIQLIGVRIVGPRVNEVVTETTQGVSLLASIAAGLTSDPSSAAALQTLAALGMTPCGQPTAKHTLSNYRTLGPLPVGIDGYLGVVVGNFVIAFAVASAQCIVATVLVVRLEMSLSAAMATLRAPSLTITAFFTLYQGTSYAAAQLLSLPDSTPAERGVGGVVLLLCLCLPPWIMWWASKRLTRFCMMYDYHGAATPHDDRYRTFAALMLLPRGRIEPQEVSQKYAVLVAPFVRNNVELPVLSILVPYFFTLLTLWHPSSAFQCSLFYFIAAVIHVAVCVWTLYWAPHRHLHGSPLFAVSILLNALLIAASWAGLYQPRLVTRSMVAGVATAQVVLQFVRALLFALGVVLERTLHEVQLVQAWSTGEHTDAVVGECAAPVRCIDVGSMSIVGDDEDTELEELPELHKELEVEATRSERCWGEQCNFLSADGGSTLEAFDDLSLIYASSVSDEMARTSDVGKRRRRLSIQTVDETERQRILEDLGF